MATFNSVKTETSLSVLNSDTSTKVSVQKGITISYKIHVDQKTLLYKGPHHDKKEFYNRPSKHDEQ